MPSLSELETVRYHLLPRSPQSRPGRSQPSKSLQEACHFHKEVKTRDFVPNGDSNAWQPVMDGPGLTPSRRLSEACRFHIVQSSTTGASSSAASQCTSLFGDALSSANSSGPAVSRRRAAQLLSEVSQTAREACRFHTAAELGTAACPMTKPVNQVLTPSSRVREACRFEQHASRRRSFQPIGASQTAVDACRFHLGDTSVQSESSQSIRRSCSLPPPSSDSFEGTGLRFFWERALLGVPATLRSHSARRAGFCNPGRRSLTPSLRTRDACRFFQGCESPSAKRHFVPLCDPNDSPLTASLESKVVCRYEGHDGATEGENCALLTTELQSGSPLDSPSRIHRFVAKCDPNHASLTPSATSVHACRFEPQSPGRIFDKPCGTGGAPDPPSQLSFETFSPFAQRQTVSSHNPRRAGVPTASIASQKACRYHLVDVDGISGPTRRGPATCGTIDAPARSTMGAETVALLRHLQASVKLPNNFSPTKAGSVASPTAATTARS